ncbi:MAG: hypothetical protein IKA99_05970 [Clostridia bacterium]|nr:hypothetical protein [Clostridia bacterium]
MTELLVVNQTSLDKPVENNTDVKEVKAVSEENVNRNTESAMVKSFNLDKTALVFGQSEEDIGKEFNEFKALKLFKRVDVDLTSVRDTLVLKQKIDETSKYGFGNVVVNPRHIKDAKRYLKGRKIGVFAAVCYPYGEELYGVKKYAVKRAVQEGADGVYLPLSITDLKSGKIELIRRELQKIVKKYKNKKIFVVLEMAELNFAYAEKLVKLLLKTKIAGIVSGTGNSSVSKPFAGASDLHSLSSGKRTVVACSNTEKSRDVVGLFSVADRVFLKNAPKIAKELKTNLEI